ncbi:hypothetical protein BDZ97DRAFT_739213 [Flammula alnicola]|nr:hypothetical protein BDZ97DRAFT_739213 [Flammula alnicola]
MTRDTASTQNYYFHPTALASSLANDSQAKIVDTFFYGQFSIVTDDVCHPSALAFSNPSFHDVNPYHVEPVYFQPIQKDRAGQSNFTIFQRPAVVADHDNQFSEIRVNCRACFLVAGSGGGDFAVEERVDENGSMDGCLRAFMVVSFSAALGDSLTTSTRPTHTLPNRRQIPLMHPKPQTNLY